MSEPALPPVPERVPQLHGRFWPWFCRGMLRLGGWRLVGELPNVAKLVVIGAPHSSNWDGVWGLLMKVGLRLDISIMIKREALNGPFGPILRAIGMIPIHRGAALDVVGQMVQRFASHEKMWLGITPEGTRKRVAQWKTGFMRIARDAHVPILPVFFDYPSKTFILGPLFHPGDDMETDMAAIRAQFRPYRGKRRNSE